MRKLTTLFLVLFAAFTAHAQTPVFLTKAEVEVLAIGKKWNIVPVASGHKIRWDIRSNGELFGNNYTVNGQDSAKWLVNDAAQFCTKWRGRSVDRCIAIAKDGEAYLTYDSADLKTVLAKVAVE